MKPTPHFSNDSAHGRRNNQTATVPARLRTPAARGKAPAEPAACRAAAKPADPRRLLLLGIVAGVIFMLALLLYGSWIPASARADKTFDPPLPPHVSDMEAQTLKKLHDLKSQLNDLKQIDDWNRKLKPFRKKPDPRQVKKLEHRLNIATALYNTMMKQEKDLQKHLSVAETQKQKLHYLQEMKKQKALAEKMKAAERELQKEEQRQQGLKAQIEQEQKKEKQLKDLQEQKDKLQKIVDSPENKQKQELLRRLIAKDKEINDVKTDFEDTVKKIKEIGQKPPRSGNGTGEEITLPFNFPKGEVHPLYIECHAAGLTIYRYQFEDGGGIVKGNVPLDSIDEDSKQLKSVIDCVTEDHNNHGKLVINLQVRPSGIRAFSKVQRIIEKADNPFGTVPYNSFPLPDTGKLNFAEEDKE